MTRGTVPERRPRTKPWFLAGAVVGTAILGATGNWIFTSLTSAVEASRPPITVVVDFLGDGNVPVVVNVSARNGAVLGEVLNSEWAQRRGGAISSGASINLTVQGASDKTVVIQGIKVIDVERLPYPRDPVNLCDCLPSGGELGVRYFDLNFESEYPTLVPMQNAEWPDGPDAEAVEFPFSVSESDVEVFFVEAWGPKEGIYKWRLRLDWTSDGESGHTIVGGPDKIQVAISPQNEEPDFWGRSGDGTWQNFG